MLHEAPETTARIAKIHKLLAEQTIGKDATTFAPIADDKDEDKIVKGCVKEIHILLCGDPLYKFVTEDGNQFWVHEIDVCEKCDN
jgi:hypothetical protein